MADVDHPKTHVEDQDVDLPRKQPESPKHEGIDPLTESDTLYPAENVQANAKRFNRKEEAAAVEARENDSVESEDKVASDVEAQQELQARANTPNDLLPKSEEDQAKDDGRVETKTTKEAVAEDNAQIESGDLEDKETGTQNTSPSNKTTPETLQDEVKQAEKKVSTKTPKS